MSDVLQRIAGKALVVNAGKVLILREASTYKDGTNAGRYQLPGGRIEPNEKFFDGLRREVKEESGLIVDPLKPVYVGEWFPTIRGVAHHITAIFYVCRPLTTDVVLSDEHDHFVWVEPDRIVDYDMTAPEPEAIKAWLADETY